MSAIRILLIEPDQTIVTRFSTALRYDFYDVDTAMEGRAAIATLAARHHDMLIVNRCLPDTDGCSLCLEARRIIDNIPVVMIAPPESNALLEGFSAGIDDYLTLPVDHRELIVRVRAVIRRCLPDAPICNRLRSGDIILDSDSKLVHQAGKPIAVTSSEFLLLEYMMRNKNRIITKEELVCGAWGERHRYRLGKIPVHMNNLRNKLKDGACRPNLYTVSRKGYLLAENLDENAIT